MRLRQRRWPFHTASRSLGQSVAGDTPTRSATSATEGGDEPPERFGDRVDFLAKPVGRPAAKAGFHVRGEISRDEDAEARKSEADVSTARRLLLQACSLGAAPYPRRLQAGTQRAHPGRHRRHQQTPRRPFLVLQTRPSRMNMIRTLETVG